MTKVLKNSTRFQNYSITELSEFSSGLSTFFLLLADSEDFLTDKSMHYISRLAVLQIDITEEISCRIPFEIKENIPAEEGGPNEKNS